MVFYHFIINRYTMVFRIFAPLRSWISFHAFGASALQELRNESLEQEIHLISSHAFSNGILNDMHFSDFIVQQNTLYCFCLIVGYLGFNEFYGPSSSLSKLRHIPEFEKKRKLFRFTFITFLVLFFRNIENAI